MKRNLAVVFALLLFSSTRFLLGDEADPKVEKKSDAVVRAEEKLSVTAHTAVINGREVSYSATAGKLALKTDEGTAKAHVFFIAYTKQSVSDVGQRPLTFCFNGGPGSSSVWLHLGMLGPQRVKMPDDATPLRPPYRLHPNPYSLLDVTDLVFIDPVSTGYSRPLKDEDKKEFHGYDEDIRSVAQFIHDYTTRYERWRSPKLLIGESYGGLRAAGLAGQLRERYNFELNGVILVSAVLDFQTLRFGIGNDLPNVLFLPTYAATAWYHKALPGELQKLPLRTVVQHAEQFALGPYALALLKGDALSTDERTDVAETLARYSGLSKQFVEGADLRISMSRFSKELLRKRQRTVGRLDSRYVGIDRDSVGESYEYDASGAAISGPFTATLNDYVRGELKYEDEHVYEILTDNVRPWSYKRFENQYVDVSETLRAAMTANPFLKLFVACGYYDLATPHFAMAYTIDHLRLASQLRENVTVKYYEGGHMMYIHEPSLRQLRADLHEFYTSAVAQEQRRGE